MKFTLRAAKFIKIIKFIYLLLVSEVIAVQGSTTKETNRKKQTDIEKIGKKQLREMHAVRSGEEN